MWARAIAAVYNERPSGMICSNSDRNGVNTSIYAPAENGQHPVRMARQGLVCRVTVEASNDTATIHIDESTTVRVMIANQTPPRWERIGAYGSRVLAVNVQRTTGKLTPKDAAAANALASSFATAVLSNFMSDTEIDQSVLVSRKEIEGLTTLIEYHKQRINALHLAKTTGSVQEPQQPQPRRQ